MPPIVFDVEIETNNPTRQQPKIISLNESATNLARTERTPQKKQFEKPTIKQKNFKNATKFIFCIVSVGLLLYLLKRFFSWETPVRPRGSFLNFRMSSRESRQNVDLPVGDGLKIKRDKGNVFVQKIFRRPLHTASASQPDYRKNITKVVKYIGLPILILAIFSLAVIWIYYIYFEDVPKEKILPVFPEEAPIEEKVVEEPKEEVQEENVIDESKEEKETPLEEEKVAEEPKEETPPEEEKVAEEPKEEAPPEEEEVAEEPKEEAPPEEEEHPGGKGKGQKKVNLDKSVFLIITGGAAAAFNPFVAVVAGISGYLFAGEKNKKSKEESQWSWNFLQPEKIKEPIFGNDSEEMSEEEEPKEEEEEEEEEKDEPEEKVQEEESKWAWLNPKKLWSRWYEINKN